jgi:hypothetical protein
MAGIFDIFSTGPADQAAQAQQQGLQQGYGQLSSLLGAGNQTLASNYGQALQPYQQNYQQAQGGVQQLMNALGLGGAAGNAAATQGFQNNPGYQFQLQQGIQNVDRNQAASGMLGSGNTDAAVANYSSGLANQGWQQYLNQLQPFLGATQNAAQGIGGLFSQLGQGINQNINTQGQAAYGTQQNIGNAQANADLSAYGTSGNLLGALLGLGKLGVSGGAGAGSGGTFGGNLLSGLFGGR